jgi:hypothetical protein
MKLADDIRTFAYEKYISPAIAAGKAAIVIRTGDVHSDMGLQSRMPSVCGALESLAFSHKYALELTARRGPSKGANVFLEFRVTPTTRIHPKAPSGEGKRHSQRPSQSLPAPAVPVLPGTVHLVSCVSRKAAFRIAAKDLYLSDWFIKARAFVEARNGPWFILSAEHGLLAPDKVVDPYELTLNNMPIADRRRWAEKVLQQISEMAPDAKAIVFLAGMRYREFLVDLLRGQGITVEIPMEGLRIGEQLAWLSARSNDG